MKILHKIDFTHLISHPKQQIEYFNYQAFLRINFVNLNEKEYEEINS